MTVKYQKIINKINQYNLERCTAPNILFTSLVSQLKHFSRTARSTVSPTQQTPVIYKVYSYVALLGKCFKQFCCVYRQGKQKCHLLT